MTNLARTDYFESLLMYRLVRMNEPPFLLSLFKPYKSDKPIRGPRIDLDPITENADWGFYSFQVKYENYWNKIPPCIWDLPSYSRFKKATRQYIYRLDITDQ